MIAISSRPPGRIWNKISFASTLYLCPVLDLLVAELPDALHAEIRLGLQEALVNAAKHGNNLDPSKTVVVHFSAVADSYWWVISDQGSGFAPECCCQDDPDRQLPPEESECGRGLFILHQIFDQVNWNSDGTQLSLCKQIKRRLWPPLFANSHSSGSE